MRTPDAAASKLRPLFFAYKIRGLSHHHGMLVPFGPVRLISMRIPENCFPGPTALSAVEIRLVMHNMIYINKL
jgi:hypothetical protein